MRPKLLSRLFSGKSVSEQEKIWREEWDNRLWRNFLKTIGGKFIWKYILRDPGFYQHVPDDFDISDYLINKFNESARLIDFRKSFFATLLLWGKFIEMNAENLIFQNNSFDTVSISHSLHHITNVDKVLSEMMRVLKPNGYFIVQEPFRDGFQTDAQQTDIAQHHWDSQIDSLLNIPHKFTLRKNEIKEIVMKLGLSEVKTVESTHFVKCLFCEENFDCDDPKNPSITKFVNKEIDRNLKRLSKLEKHPDHKKLKKEGEELKERVNKTGSAAASHLFFIGRKS